MNKLYYGDNLDVLRRDVGDETVDLIYADPPFNSNADYNVIFARQNVHEGDDAAAQIQAFSDTWVWTSVTEEQFEDYTGPRSNLPDAVIDALNAFVTLLGRNDATSYLVNMAPRLVQSHRVLKRTGSLYLHCDPTMSHYLKVLLDAIFGAANFKSEIIWRRTGSHGSSKRYAPVHDVILFYTKSKQFTWNNPKRPYMRGHVEEYFVETEEGWRTNYYGNVLTGSGLRGGESGLPWRGVDPSSKGRHWAIPGALLDGFEVETAEMGQHEKMDFLLEKGLIRFVEGQYWPIYERYIQPGDGLAVPDIWAFQPYTKNTVFGTNDGIDEDVRWLSTKDSERLGYPTQKPRALLERILQASSNPGDVVLDPFCGCGTTVDAAQVLGRSWIGIDVTYLAIDLIRKRLEAVYGEEIHDSYEVGGVPRDQAAALALFERSKLEFERWAVSLVYAKPNKKQVGDRGIDGVARFRTNTTARGAKGKYGRMLVSVKGGRNVNPSMVRDLMGTVRTEKAELGLLITNEKPTPGMREAAVNAGVYRAPWLSQTFPTIQIITAAELLQGKRPSLPGMENPYMEAKREAPSDEQGAFDLA